MRTIAIVVLSCFVTVFGYPRDVRAASDGGGGGGEIIWMVPLALLGLYVLFSGGRAPWEEQRTDRRTRPAAADIGTAQGQGETDEGYATGSEERSASKRRFAFDLASACIRF